MIDNISLNSKERTKKRRQRSDLMKKFGINSDQYEAVLKEQNYVCGICLQPDPCKRMLAVDHSHINKKVRGLLCTNCNMALGKFQDSIENLKRAISYLEKNYQVPDIKDTIEFIDHNDRPNWKVLVKTPDGLFPSLQNAADYYKVHSTTVRLWCKPDSKSYRPGFSSEKVFSSLNKLKEYCDGKNKGL
jgi:hypothetical protein